MTYETSTSNSSETERLAEHLGQHLKGGEVIELVSDLGGGKTTFVRGLARGIQSNDHVSSPTFKICNIYRGRELVAYHYDFYRLHEAGLIELELTEALEDDKNVTIVEWAEVVDQVLPDNRLVIHIESLDETTRKIIYNYPDTLAYLIK